MKSKHFLSVFLLFILSIGSVWAQDSLTLRAALNYAIENSEVLEKARLEIVGGQHKVAEVKAGALPQIDVTSSATYNLLIPQFVFPDPATGEFTTITIGQNWQAVTQVQLNQEIFNQSVFTGLKAARSSEEYYRLSAELSEENVIQQVAAAYYQVIINKEQLKVIDANLDRTEKLLAMVNSQFDLGLAKKIDLDRVNVNKSNLVAQRQELETAITQQHNLLKYYMGMPVSEKIQLPYNAVSELEHEAMQLNNDGFNLERLAQFKVLKSQETLLQHQRKANLAEYYPSLSLGANYMLNTQSDKFNLYTRNALNFDMSAITLSLRIPIFDGFARRSRVRQSNVELQKIHQDIRNTSNSLKMSYDNANNQLKTSLTTIRTQEENKKLAEEVFYSTQNNYKNGLASLTDLLTSETDLVAAQNSYNEALLKYKVAQIELIKSNGNIKSLLTE
ncbi:TolC family protein [Olivibacter sp. SDN3]|uniref:TolC family protein n=1 Tax=Olivibacter sp. SDN3 TaxID=2764720 RepID=UPI001650F2CA|nr:TolC family protein [Olivibacter sp. SDN3]QNL51483.1 TolC family protein [Olivibacter sp. SDN3]